MKQNPNRIPLILLSWLIIAGSFGCSNREPSPVSTLTAVSPTAVVSCPDGNEPVRISQIQGAQHRSPMDGEQISCVFGIVTAVKGDGFYMQDPNPDSDESTSEGIFIDTRTFVRVDVGDEVRVGSGTVREDNPAGPGANSLTTTVIKTGEVDVLSSGNKLPDPIIIGKSGRIIPNEKITGVVDGYVGRSDSFVPDEYGMDFFESLESMRVQVNDALAISPTSNFSEVVVVGDNGENAAVLSNRGELIARQEDFNPERLMLDDAFIMMPDILVGAKFTEPIVGIVDYTFGNYKIQPTEKLQFIQGNPQPDSSDYQVSSNEISFATYNVENLNMLDDPSRLEKLAQEITQGLLSPDVLVLQEIQDDDGLFDSNVITAEKTLALIVNSITNAGGPAYKTINIDPDRNADGGALGGNIRVVMLYRTDRGLRFTKRGDAGATDATEFLDFNGTPKLSLNPGRIWPQNSAFINSRRPLVAEFTYNGNVVYVIGTHFNSKGEDGPLYGDRQPLPQDSIRQRNAQAKAVNGFIRDIHDIDPQAYVIVLGDFNDFPWSEPIKILQTGLLVNLIEDLPVQERFTYIYEGNAEVLDQILVSDSLKSRVTYLKIVHLNTEQLPETRLSDHDPVLAVIKLE